MQTYGDFQGFPLFGLVIWWALLRIYIYAFRQQIASENRIAWELPDILVLLALLKVVVTGQTLLVPRSTFHQFVLITLATKMKLPILDQFFGSPQEVTLSLTQAISTDVYVNDSYIHNIDMYICYIISYIYLEFIQAVTEWMFGKPFKVLPAGCLFVSGGTSRPAALKWNTSALALRNRRCGQSQTVLGTSDDPPLLGWSFDPPREDFLTAGTWGYRVIGPLWKRVASSSR